MSMSNIYDKIIELCREENWYYLSVFLYDSETYTKEEKRNISDIFNEFNLLSYLHNSPMHLFHTLYDYKRPGCDVFLRDLLVQLIKNQLYIPRKFSNVSSSTFVQYFLSSDINTYEERADFIGSCFAENDSLDINTKKDLFFAYLLGCELLKMEFKSYCSKDHNFIVVRPVKVAEDRVVVLFLTLNSSTVVQKDKPLFEYNTSDPMQMFHNISVPSSWVSSDWGSFLDGLYL
jgi:hypothetical protein